MKKETKARKPSAFFYYVHLEGRSQPQKKHLKIVDAITEATRLSLKEQVRATVIKCIETHLVHYVKPTVWLETIK